MCHHKDVNVPLVSVGGEAFDLRWEAHQQVKKFDLKPSLANAEAAAAALTKYAEYLKKTNDRRPE